MANAHLQGFIHRLRTAAAARGSPAVPDAQLLERFTARHDEAAFELLVWRHGKMVFNVCRRLLSDAHEAEDAFQACFLTLARRAGSISRRESLPGWLHRVAYRIALDVRGRSARRAGQEAASALEYVPGGDDPAAEAVWREVRRVIDDEVGRLPHKYRLPFILCHLQGLTNAEAARELGCPVGTVESRLTWARQRLRARLARRGVAVSASLLVALLWEKAAAASVPALLVGAAAKATASPMGLAAAGVISARVASLADGALRGLLLTRVKAAACVVLAAGLVAAGAGGLTCRMVAAAPGAPAEAAPPAAPAKEGPPREEARESQAQRIERLVKQLGSDRFDEREAASRGLEEIGVPALPALGRAALSADAETRRRAEELVEKIGRVALRQEVLRPTRLRLACKDTPLGEAVADLGRKSGYVLALHDPDGKLKGRTVTLDTGDTTFWQAFDQFCRAAGLVEGEAQPGQFALEDGKAEALPTCYAGSVRVRGRAAPADAGDDEFPVRLQFSLEPKAGWHERGPVRLGKALDDLGQALEQAQGRPARGGPRFVAVGVTTTTAGGPPNSTDLLHSFRLKRGETSGKGLRELAGELSAEVVTAPAPVVTVEDLLRAGGKGFRGERGGSLTVLDVAREDAGQVKVRLKLAAPADVVAAAGVTWPVRGVRKGSGRGGLIIVIGGDPGPLAPDFGPGLLLFDGKGEAVAREVTRIPPGGEEPGGAFEYVVTFPPPKDRGAVKLVFSASRAATIDVPFTLKDVPLP
jgi:RNA polymerase sigma factor (sigma-70 family)